MTASPVVRKVKLLCPMAPKATRVYRSMPTFNFRVKLFEEIPSIGTLQTISDIFARVFGIMYPKLKFTLLNMEEKSREMLTFLRANALTHSNIIKHHFMMLRAVFTAYEVPVQSELNALAELIYIETHLVSQFASL